MVILIGMTRMKALDDSNVSDIDRLVFQDPKGGMGAYVGHPFQITSVVVYLASVYLLILLLRAANPAWGPGSWLIPDVTVASYSAFYYARVRASLQRQLVDVTGAGLPRSPLARLLSLVGRGLRSVWGRLGPRGSLGWGSLMILTTLFLTVGVDKCGEPKATGYELIIGTPNAIWPSQTLQESFMVGIIRGAYGSAAVIAVATVILVSWSFREAGLLRSRLVVRKLQCGYALETCSLLAVES